MPGDHYTALREPQVWGLAERLADALAAAGAGDWRQGVAPDATSELLDHRNAALAAEES